MSTPLGRDFYIPFRRLSSSEYVFVGTMSPQMKLQTKLVRDGNGWVLRFPKNVQQLSGFEPGILLQLHVKQNRIIIYRGDHSLPQSPYRIAYEQAKTDWNEAFTEAWIEMFGIEE